MAHLNFLTVVMHFPLDYFTNTKPSHLVCEHPKEHPIHGYQKVGTNNTYTLNIPSFTHVKKGKARRRLAGFDFIHSNNFIEF